MHFRHRNQGAGEGVDRRQFKIVAEFFPQGNAAAPIARRTAVVSKSFGKEILEKLFGGQTAAASKKGNVAVVVMKGGHLENTPDSHLSLDCQLFVAAAL